MGHKEKKLKLPIQVSDYKKLLEIGERRAFSEKYKRIEYSPDIENSLSLKIKINKENIFEEAFQKYDHFLMDITLLVHNLAIVTENNDAKLTRVLVQDILSLISTSANDIGILKNKIKENNNKLEDNGNNSNNNSNNENKKNKKIKNNNSSNNINNNNNNNNNNNLNDNNTTSTSSSATSLNIDNSNNSNIEDVKDKLNKMIDKFDSFMKENNSDNYNSNTAPVDNNSINNEIKDNEKKKKKKKKELTVIENNSNNKNISNGNNENLPTTSILTTSSTMTISQISALGQQQIENSSRNIKSSTSSIISTTSTNESSTTTSAPSELNKKNKKKKKKNKKIEVESETDEEILKQFEELMIEKFANNGENELELEKKGDENSNKKKNIRKKKGQQLLESNESNKSITAPTKSTTTTTTTNSITAKLNNNNNNINNNNLITIINPDELIKEFENLKLINNMIYKLKENEVYVKKELQEKIQVIKNMEKNLKKLSAKVYKLKKNNKAEEIELQKIKIQNEAEEIKLVYQSFCQLLKQYSINLMQSIKSKPLLTSEKIPELKHFNESLLNYFNENKCTNQNRFKAFERLSLILKSALHVKTLLFGSSLNDMALKQSDIDVCLINDKSNKRFLFIVSSILKRNNYENIITLSHTRIPLIKFFDPTFNVQIDLCINNLLAVENSILIKSYSSIDPRFQMLYMLIKAWAKAKELNDASDESLSSYSYANLVIFYLQVGCNPPVLPCLHSNTESLKKRIVENISVSFHQDSKSLGFISKNTLTVGELFYNFFCFYSTFDFKKYAICISKGKMVELKECPQELLAAPSSIVIQDPFIFDFNPGKSMTEKNFIKLIAEIHKTIYIVSNGAKDYGVYEIFNEPSLLSLCNNVKQHNLNLIINNDNDNDNNQNSNNNQNTQNNQNHNQNNQNHNNKKKNNH